MNQEVEALDRRFDMWLLPGNGAAVLEGAKTQRVAPSSRDITADLPPEVAAFEVVQFGYIVLFACDDRFEYGVLIVFELLY